MRKEKKRGITFVKLQAIINKFVFTGKKKDGDKYESLSIRRRAFVQTIELSPKNKKNKKIK